MPRHRVGAALLLPQPLASEIDGLRRALGDRARVRVPPHCTLIPPVNVAEAELDRALTVLREAAASVDPLRLRVGPAATFHPVNPVLYLTMGGDQDQVAAMYGLRDALFRAPLARSLTHEFVPHVTICDDAEVDRIPAAVAALGHFEIDVTIDRVHLLAEGQHRVWSPIADAVLGATSTATVGRGSLPLALSVSGRPDPEAAALLALESDVPGLPFAVTARRDRAVVAAAWGWSSGDHLTVADLAVAAAVRNEGVGRQLLAAVEDLGRRRGCTAAGIRAGTAGPAAALLSGRGWVQLGEVSGDGRRAWQRQLS